MKILYRRSETYEQTIRCLAVRGSQCLQFLNYMTSVSEAFGLISEFSWSELSSPASSTIFKYTASIFCLDFEALELLKLCVCFHGCSFQGFQPN